MIYKVPEGTYLHYIIKEGHHRMAKQCKVGNSRAGKTFFTSGFDTPAQFPEQRLPLRPTTSLGVAYPPSNPTGCDLQQLPISSVTASKIPGNLSSSVLLRENL